jgi:integrase
VEYNSLKTGGKPPAGFETPLCAIDRLSAIVDNRVNMHHFQPDHVSVYRSIRVPHITDLGRTGQAGHFRKVNEQTEVTLDVIDAYLCSLTHLHKRSLYALSCCFKTALVRALGPEYTFNYSVKFVVDQFFRQFACYDKSARARHRCTLEELRLFMGRCSPRVGYFAEFLWWTGIRVSPMCDLKISDLEWIEGVDGEPDTVEFVTVQKNGRKNRVLLLAEFVRQVRRFFRGKVYLFETENQTKYNRKAIAAMMRSQSEKHLGYRVTPHSFRHAMLHHYATRDSNRFQAACNQAGIEPTTAYKYYSYDLLKASDLERVALWSSAG